MATLRCKIQHKEIQLQVVVARVAIIAPTVATQNTVAAVVAEPLLGEVRYSVQVAVVVEEHLQTMVLLEEPGRVIPQVAEEPPALLLKVLAQQEPVESSDAVMAEAVVRPAVPAEGLAVLEGLAECRVAAEDLVE